MSAEKINLEEPYNKQFEVLSEHYQTACKNKDIKLLKSDLDQLIVDCKASFGNGYILFWNPKPPRVGNKQALNEIEPIYNGLVKLLEQVKEDYDAGNNGEANGVIINCLQNLVNIIYSREAKLSLLRAAKHNLNKEKPYLGKKEKEARKKEIIEVMETWKRKFENDIKIFQVLHIWNPKITINNKAMCKL